MKASLAVIAAALLLVATIAVADEGKPACNTQFGAHLGAVDGVVAYSNCNDDTVSEAYHIVDSKYGREQHTIYHSPPDGHEENDVAETGMKWQCVEFARRYMFMKNRVVFEDVVGAEDIWQLRWASAPRDHDTRRTHLDRLENSVTTTFPQKGDMVIWHRQGEDMPYGHVAIVTEVTSSMLSSSKTVRIAEQNYHSVSWEGRDYSRELTATSESNGAVKLTDPDGYTIIGWMRLNPNTEAHQDTHHNDNKDKIEEQESYLGEYY